MTTLAVVLFAFAIAIGTYQGRIETTPFTRVLTAVVLVGLSNLLASWPFFGEDPYTWFSTYVTALSFTGLISLIFHVAPFLLAWHVAKWVTRV